MGKEADTNKAGRKLVPATQVVPSLLESGPHEG